MWRSTQSSNNETYRSTTPPERIVSRTSPHRKGQSHADESPATKKVLHSVECVSPWMGLALPIRARCWIHWGFNALHRLEKWKLVHALPLRSQAPQ